MDWSDLAIAALVAVGVVLLLGLAVIGFVMWRWKIPPRGIWAVFGALAYLVMPIDVLPEVLLGPLGLVDDAGVVALTAVWVYKLVKVRQRLVEGGVIKSDRAV
jgi:uncharacterized membrane protein YkvA (DUF1232 family)